MVQRVPQSISLRGSAAERSVASLPVGTPLLLAASCAGGLDPGASGSSPFALRAGGPPASSGVLTISQTIAKGTNILFRGTIAIGAGAAASVAEATQGPQAAPRAESVLRDVTAEYGPR